MFDARPYCEFTYSGLHNAEVSKTIHGKIAKCDHCKGEWEMRDGKTSLIKQPINPWADES